MLETDAGCGTCAGQLLEVYIAVENYTALRASQNTDVARGVARGHIRTSVVLTYIRGLLNTGLISATNSFVRIGVGSGSGYYPDYVYGVYCSCNAT